MRRMQILPLSPIMRFRYSCLKFPPLPPIAVFTPLDNAAFQHATVSSTLNSIPPWHAQDREPSVNFQLHEYLRGNVFEQWKSITVPITMKNCRQFINRCSFVKEDYVTIHFDLILKHEACTLTVHGEFVLFKNDFLHHAADGKLRTRFCWKLWKFKRYICLEAVF